MVVACGQTALIYGKGVNNYGIAARPSFEYAEEFLEQTEELKILVKAHPTLPNLRTRDTGETLLHRAVRLRMLDAVKVLLTSSCTLGLIPDTQAARKLCFNIIAEGLQEPAFKNDGLESIVLGMQNVLGDGSFVNIRVHKKHFVLPGCCRRRKANRVFGLKDRRSWTVTFSVYANGVLEDKATFIENSIKQNNGEEVFLSLFNNFEIRPSKVQASCFTSESVPGRCALREALDQGQKEIVTLLLRSLVSQKISNAPGSLEELTEVKNGKYRSTLSKLGAVFPDLYLQFLSELKMEEAGSIVQGKVSVAPLKEDIYLSLDRRAPVNLWQEYLNHIFIMKKMVQE